MDLDLLMVSILEAHSTRSDLHLENIMSASYTTELETGSLLDLGIWSNCGKFVVNFNIRSALIPVGKKRAVAGV